MLSDDPVRDYSRYDAEREEALERLPVCDYCGEHIQDDYYYEIGDEVICRECLDSNYRKSVDDLD